MIIRYMGSSVLHEKLKISGFQWMGNTDVISIYGYPREENIDMISILIFANIVISILKGTLETSSMLA